MAALALTGVLILAGCSSGSSYGGAFSFVSPGGQTELSYPVDQRQPIGNLSGPDLVGDRTAAVSDYPGKVVVLNFWAHGAPPALPPGALTPVDRGRDEFGGVFGAARWR